MYLRILKPDKTEFQGHNCCSIINNEIVIDTSVGNGEQILSCAGKNICELHLTDEDYKTLTTWDFVIDVAPRVHNGEGIQSSDSWDILDEVLENFESHVGNKENPHEVTMSQLGMDNVENKSSEMIRDEITKDNVTTALGYTPYTPTDVDNKLSMLESSLDWKETVSTFEELITTYSNPEKGWTVNVGDENGMTTYRYNGSEWVDIGVTVIPKATESNDGLMSKEDKAKLDNMSSGGGSGVAGVSGVKGSAETDFRIGQVSISAEDVGAMPDIITVTEYPYNGITDILKLPIGIYRFPNSSIWRQFENRPMNTTGMIEVNSFQGGNPDPFSQTWAYKNYIYISSLNGIINVRTLNSRGTGENISDTGWLNIIKDSEILDTSALINSNTSAKKVAGALAVKELNTNLQNTIYSSGSTLGEKVKYLIENKKLPTNKPFMVRESNSGHHIYIGHIYDSWNYGGFLVIDFGGDVYSAKVSNGTLASLTKIGEYATKALQDGNGKNIANTYLSYGGYYDGTKTSINDILTPGISRIYIQYDSDDANYLLGSGGQCIIENTINVGFIFQKIINLNSGDMFVRRNATQGTIELDYTVPMKIISNRYIQDLGTHFEAASGTTGSAPNEGMALTSGLFMTESYKDSNAPTQYGNIINIAGKGTGQIYCGWSGADNTTDNLYYRSHRDTSTGGWGAWKRLATSEDISSLQTSFQDGCSKIATAITNNGVSTASNASPNTMATNINTLATKKYNEGLSNAIKVVSKCCNISEGSWTGAKLSDSSWVALGTSSVTSLWRYNFGTTIDISKVKFISGSFIESTNWIRINRGYAPNSSTSQNYFYPSLHIYGNKDVASDSITPHIFGGISESIYAGSGAQSVCASLRNNYTTNSSNSSTMKISVYSDCIIFTFSYDGHNFGSIKSTSPKFAFTIGYTE